MKNILYAIFVSVASVASIQAQIFTTEVTTAGAPNSFAFLDASSNAGYTLAIGTAKGILFPKTDITLVTTADIFDLGAAGAPDYNPNFYDGLVVYNTGTGSTSIGTVVSVTPGFYYFSNPDGAQNFNMDGGTWLPLGGTGTSGVKSKAVEVVVGANPTSATLDLGTSVISADEVDSFLGAKIYNSTGDLVMTADSAYNKSTNVLTTGNGIMYQVLPEGTYTVVVEYK